MKRLLVGVLSSVLLSFLPWVSAQALVIQLVPSSSTVTIGSTLNLDLLISGLGDQSAPSLSVFDLDLHFDPVLLGLDTADRDGNSVIDSVVLDPTGQLDLFGGGFNGVSAGLIAPHTLNLFELSFDLPTDLDALQASQFTLASITFKANTPGIGLFTLGVNILGDALGDSLQSTLEPLSTVTMTVQSLPTPIPEPASGLLVLTGLWALRRRGQCGDNSASMPCDPYTHPLWSLAP